MILHLMLRFGKMHKMKMALAASNHLEQDSEAAMETAPMIPSSFVKRWLWNGKYADADYFSEYGR